jgi:hypothetical protein
LQPQSDGLQFENEMSFNNFNVAIY